MKNDNGFPAPSKDEESKLVSRDKQNRAERPSPRVGLYEKNRRMVYAAGNKWAIENFHATHD